MGSWLGAAPLAPDFATIDALEKTTAESVVYVHTEERFVPWAAGGLVVLLLSQLLSQTWLRRLP